ncbi:FTR1 family iron permease [Denitratisoma oestradiolicum]|uniref:FTR1 family iron permease n=1 Tax=Denitratisoma oestradiolicum TaxID=311182 RepID=A0A6S6Y2T0_9PROT|nr:FTR1 family protein [Denitratisoma oestradiolicum]TWO79891.1 FTR1 family iron permease [Denitratisoma oestradiolicum]CAB1369643.1 FTR1 family iron permease [Denitratisoma oestradiolicum]
MLNSLIVVFRESLEAMLVVGVLLAWIARQPDPGGLRRSLWAGVAAGLGLALALGFATFAAQSQLAGDALEKFQVGMVLFAAALIVQMVLWMHRHGRHMRRELETRAGHAAGALGLGAVTALAVAREGAETVVFLYGLGLEGNGGLLAGAFAGFVLAAATAWLVARGARFLSYRALFSASEILLLIIASALLAAGVDRMIGLEWLPPLLDPVWDSSSLLDDSSGVGRLLADFTGYRARPSASLLLAYGSFWCFSLWRLGRATPAPANGKV